MLLRLFILNSGNYHLSSFKEVRLRNAIVQKLFFSESGESFSILNTFFHGELKNFN
jgi:hypothetical protein